MNRITGEAIWAHDYANIGGQDVLLDAALAHDNKIICVGNSRTPVTQAVNCWLLMISEAGDIVWSRTYGDGYDVQGHCVATTPDGGFGIAGTAMQVEDGETSDWRLMRTNHVGDSLWSVLIGDSSDDVVTDLIVNSVGDFVIVGFYAASGHAAAVSETGQLLWDRTYDHPSDMRIYSGFEIPGGGYWVCGSVSAPGNGNAQSFMMELDEEGDIRQHWEYNIVPTRHDGAYGMVADEAGGAYLYGSGQRDVSGEYDVFIAHVSECGSLISVDWIGDASEESARAGTLTPDGHLVVGGTVQHTQNVWEMLFYGLETDTCNIPPCGFARIAPQDSTLPEIDNPIVMNWTQSRDLEGSPIQYIFHIESNYPEQWFISPQDTVTADSFYHLELMLPLSPLNELFDFRWTVHATDGMDTVEASNGQGFFQLDITMDANDAILNPSSFELSAYPNPFNPTTTLSFTLAAPQDVTLALYDVQGRMAQELLNGRLDAGSHDITVDGSALTSGIYFARLSAGTQSRVTKLVLMK